MGRLNTIQGVIDDTLSKIDILRKKTNQKEIQQNKGDFDRLFKKLKVYQNRLCTLGKENNIIRVTLYDCRTMYYSGITVVETKSMLNRISLRYKSIVSIKPGIILY